MPRARTWKSIPGKTLRKFGVSVSVKLAPTSRSEIPTNKKGGMYVVGGVNERFTVCKTLGPKIIAPSCNEPVDDKQGGFASRGPGQLPRLGLHAADLLVEGVPRSLELLPAAQRKGDGQKIR